MLLAQRYYSKVLTRLEKKNSILLTLTLTLTLTLIWIQNIFPEMLIGNDLKFIGLIGNG